MKIAHISDLHICNSHKKSNIKSTSNLLNYVALSRFDHLVITGDVTDNAKPEDFKTLRRLLGDFGFLKSDKLSMVIGNHDIFGTVQKMEDIISFPRNCKAIKYAKKVNEFCNYFIEAFENTYAPVADHFFPFAKKLNGNLLIGLNSIQKYSRLKNTFASNGKISKEQIGGMIDIFEKKEFENLRKIILVHHHFNNEKYKSYHFNQTLWQNIERYTMKLRKKEKILKLFKKFKVSLVLHGHLHKSEEYWKEGIRFMNAGETMENINSKNKIKLNSIKFEKDRMFCQILDFNLKETDHDYILQPGILLPSMAS
jgi:3',5'-cyclic-AMP phosphodiesterase